MADEIEDPKLENPNPNPNPKSPLPPPSSSLSLSLNIWPPSQRTRDAVAGRLVDTLSSQSSVLARRYGALPHDEAAALATEIEKEAFSFAAETAGGDEGTALSIDGGLEILEIYSKAISRKTLEVMKARGGSQTTALPATPPQPEAAAPVEGANESVEAEVPAAA